MLDVNLKLLEKTVQDFHQVTKMLIVIYDEKRNIIYHYPQNMCRFCSEVRKSSQLESRCFSCDARGFDACGETRRTEVYHCHMGLAEAVAPICENGIIIGYMMLGQILDADNRAALIRRAQDAGRQFGIDAGVLVAELNNMKIMDKQTISSVANMLELCACYLWMNHIVSMKTTSLIQHLSNYIGENIAGELTVEALCSHLHVSKSALYNLSKSTFGVGISDYIRQRRVDEAKRLLASDALRISEVASRVGIGDFNYFTKVFQRYVGATPKAYQKKAQG